VIEPPPQHYLFFLDPTANQKSKINTSAGEKKCGGGVTAMTTTTTKICEREERGATKPKKEMMTRY
jgi:hypothetical protein